MANAGDLKFVVKHTKLSKDKAKLLIEEDLDCQLLLETLAPKIEYKKNQLLDLSLRFYFRLLIYRAAKFDSLLFEKTYVADSVAQKSAEITHNIILTDLLKDKKKKDKEKFEEAAKYLLVVLGFYRDNFKEINSTQNSYKEYFNYTQELFRKIERRDIANNLQKWIDVLWEIKSQKWIDI